MKKGIVVFFLICIFGTAMGFATGSQEPASATGASMTAPGTLPLTSQPATLTIFSSPDSRVVDVETNANTAWLEKQTNVHVNWDLVTGDAGAKLQLLLNSGQKLPDIIMQAPTGAAGYYYAQQGLFIPLNDLIDKNGFYLKKVFKEVPDYVPYYTAPDGKLYTLAGFEGCYHCSMPVKMIINTDWLGKLKLQMPTTTAEFERVLQAFKTQDPNGNGKQDEIPLTGSPALGDYGSPEAFLMNSFILDEPVHRLMVQNGKIAAAYVQPAWRQGLQYMNQLYREGLLDGQMFVQDQATITQVFNSGDVPKVGAVPLWNHGWITQPASARARQYLFVPPLKGPAGNQVTPYYPDVARGGTGVAITKDAKDPTLALRWIDYTFSDEASLWDWHGIEGTDWRYAKSGEVGIDGGPAVVTDLGAQPEFQMTQQNDALSYTITYFNPTRLFGGMSFDPSTFNFEHLLIVETKNKYSAYAKPQLQVPPGVQIPPDKLQDVNRVEAALKDAVNQSIAQFVTGVKDINSDSAWQAFLDQVNKLGLTSYLTTYQTAYDQYQKMNAH